MKRILCSIAVAVAVLSSCQQATVSPAAVNGESNVMTIAYVNTDSLTANYDYAKAMNDLLNDKMESSRADFNQKATAFQHDVAEFQRKVKNNAFLSVERAQSEQNRLAKTEAELQELNQKLSGELMQEQNRLTLELQDTVRNFLKEFANGKYSLIISDGMINNNVLYAADGVDITSDVVAALNKRYAASKK